MTSLSPSFSLSLFLSLCRTNSEGVESCAEDALKRIDMLPGPHLVCDQDDPVNFKTLAEDELEELRLSRFSLQTAFADRLAAATGQAVCKSRRSPVRPRMTLQAVL